LLYIEIISISMIFIAYCCRLPLPS